MVLLVAAAADDEVVLVLALVSLSLFLGEVVCARLEENDRKK